MTAPRAPGLGPDLRRRDFLRRGGVLAAGWALGCSGEPGGRDLADLDAYLEETMERLHIPGLAGYVAREGELVWAGAKGWADLERAVPMTLDTIQNVASISKTFTATALMRLREERSFPLDVDVGAWLPFAVIHPTHPGAAITIRQLLTHKSSIDDGSSYSRLYRCGDPEISLRDWLEGYFTPGGAYFDADENFHEWPPGERYAYDNVAFGLLAHLVEVLADEPFEDYCQRRVFEPLGMSETSWRLADVAVARHAVPYTWVEDGRARGPTWGGEPLGRIGETGPSGEILGAEADGHVANCLYGHPNYPDGFLRTSVHQLARYLTAYLRDGDPILRRETVDAMLTVHSDEIWGLSWYSREVEGRTFWGHGGADPGVNTRIDLNREDGVGAIVFANTFVDSEAEEMRRINARLIAEAYR